MTTTHKHLILILALTMLLGLLSGCGAPPSLPTPTLPAPIAAANTPTPTPSPSPTPTPSPSPTPSPTPTSTPTPTPAATTVSAARSTAQPKVAPTATPQTLVMEITEAEANKMARKAMAQQQDVQIDNVAVDFRPNEMYVSGDTKIGFFKLNIGLLLDIKPVQGAPQVSIKEIYVNNGVATGFIRDQIETMIAPHLDQLAMVSEDFYVETITISPDKMIITGHYR